MFIKSELLFPNITFIKYKEIEQAIKWINQLPYGLSCSLFLQQDSKVKECINSLNVGIILKNLFLDHHIRQLRFGGDKDSSNFSNIGNAMFEAGLKRITIINNNL